MKLYQICQEGIWDTSVPGIRFNERGVSNYATIQRKLSEAFPRGEQGAQEWARIVERIRASAPQNARYDCIIGVSGGTDSSYLLHIAKEYGLRPLAVNLDNGWNSDISVKNIRKMVTALNIDLETYVIDYEEIKDILRSYLLAGLPWADAPTDSAIKAVLFQIARKEGIKYILTGTDFRSEGKQPTEWTYTDLKQIQHVHKRFGRLPMKTYPMLPVWKLFYLGYVKGIKHIAPFNYLPYQKNEAQAMLKEKYGWEYYGGHHHENLYTKFAVAYWLPRKFGIDKRRITLSAQIMSGEITRDQALGMINQPPYALEQMEADREYVMKKLDFTLEEFQKLWHAPNKSFLDYPSYYPLIRRLARLAAPVLKLVLSSKPKIFYEMEERAA
ncbi:N-acetyl sugar amidotransferase [Tellurirhabdus rosea]|uniref:N-acetyl sugar amidotransferase n=1 Tax=Tellurirhabdus rosea TaxID=2674997 RepID=UPI002254A644|nr:N-acetyl sugar amidotransferase [Tellurirhabdus rosea]